MKIEPVYDNADDRGGGQWYTVGPAIVRFRYGSTSAEEAEAKASADLIADAFNTAHETGRTPSELAAMVDRVRGIVADWNCCEDEPRASAFRLHDALIDALLADLDAKPNSEDHPDDSEGGTV